jgi:hypothetical protein
MYTSTPPVLLLVFNRPEHTGRVMERIRQAKPSKLFVAADGPREGYSEDQERCEQARQVATRVDWDSELYTLFRDVNLGCKEAVSSAITWFFEHVNEGIILEDDCVPDSTFFYYCKNLLKRYRNDERIMTISGNNFQPSGKVYQESYYFSAYMHCWGWATWRSTWQHYDGNIPAWERLRNTSWLRNWVGGKEEALYWSDIFDQVYRGKVDSWAYPWTFNCWREHGLHVIPKVNLVSNVGFGSQGTHTTNSNDTASYIPSEPMPFPLDHPDIVVRDYEADQYTSENHFIPWGYRFRRRVPAAMKSVVRSVLSPVRNLGGG